MKGAPLISVIIPSFNQGRYLEETIRSILRQDYKGVEIIVVDGESTDGSVDIIRRHAPNLKYWISEKDAGQSDAINKGLEKASGEVVTWLNSDDRYRPGTLSLAAQHFSGHPDTAIFYGRARLFGNRLFPKTIGPASAIMPHMYLPYMRFPQPASFFAREAIGQTLNERLHYAMDFELVVKNVLLGRIIKNTPHILSDYRIHPASKSLSGSRFIDEWTTVLLNIFLSLGNGAEFYDKLKALTDRPHDPLPYACTTDFSRSELSEVWLEHLHLRFHHQYRQGNLDGCIELARLIGNEDREFARQKNYSRYIRRLARFPLLLKLRRKVFP